MIVHSESLRTTRAFTRTQPKKRSEREKILPTHNEATSVGEKKIYSFVGAYKCVWQWKYVCTRKMVEYCGNSHSILYASSLSPPFRRRRCRCRVNVFWLSRQRFLLLLLVATEKRHLTTQKFILYIRFNERNSLLLSQNDIHGERIAFESFFHPQFITQFLCIHLKCKYFTLDANAPIHPNQTDVVAGSPSCGNTHTHTANHAVFIHPTYFVENKNELVFLRAFLLARRHT